MIDKQWKDDIYLAKIALSHTETAWYIQRLKCTSASHCTILWAYDSSLPIQLFSILGEIFTEQEVKDNVGLETITHGIY